jgi:hypothetical protein
VHVERPGDPIHPLPAQRAFLVQVHADVEVARGFLAGRVEHVVSGQATHFASPEALLAFMARVLTTLHSVGAEPGGAASAPSEV